MALYWDVSGVKDREVNFPPDEHGYMNDTVHNMIWWSIPVGLSRITEQNADLFWQRVVLWCAASQFGGPLPTLTQVRQLIGLSTNVSNRTDEEFARVLEGEHARQQRMREYEQANA